MAGLLSHPLHRLLPKNRKVSIVATFKRASFLDYMYFTQLETSDPVTYGNEATVKGAYEQCTLTYEQGRYNKPIPNSGGEYCDKISFVTDDYDQRAAAYQ